MNDIDAAEGGQPVPGFVACVVDDAPAFKQQALRWFVSLTRACGVRPESLLIFAAGDAARSAELRWIAGRGAEVISIAAFDARNGYCNKIEGFTRFAAMGISGPLVFTDCDLAFLGDPRRFPHASGGLTARHVEYANPPIAILDAVLALAALAPRPQLPLPLQPGLSTYLGNANGGLYILEVSTARRIAPEWARWARWLLDRIEVLDMWRIHVDQVSMMLALLSTDTPFHPLALEYNCHTHIPLPADTKRPKALHYHRQIDEGGLLKRTGASEVDGAVDEVNELLLSAAGSEGFPCAWRREGVLNLG